MMGWDAPVRMAIIQMIKRTGVGEDLEERECLQAVVYKSVIGTALTESIKNKTAAVSSNTTCRKTLKGRK